MNKAEFDQVPYGSVIRTVTTKYHNVENGNPELTFVVKKGDADDWAIYYGYSMNSPGHILALGSKVTSKQSIFSIFPCQKDVLDLYRF